MKSYEMLQVCCECIKVSSFIYAHAFLICLMDKVAKLF